MSRYTLAMTINGQQSVGSAFLQQAYGAYGRPAGAKAAISQQVAPPQKPAGAVAKMGAAGGVDVQTKTPTGVRSLVGAVVAGKVDFSGEMPTASQTGVHQLYRRPTDRVEAATVLQVGRKLDITG